MAAVRDLARADRVAASVPPDTEYVTVGLFKILPDAWAFVGRVPGSEPYRYDFGLLPTAGDQPRGVGLLVLAGRRLSVVGAAGERWSSDVSHITDLDGHRHSGFVVLTLGPGGLAISTQSAVEVPSGASWRTVRGMTNLFSGWDTALAPHGVQVHW